MVRGQGAQGEKLPLQKKDVEAKEEQIKANKAAKAKKKKKSKNKAAKKKKNEGANKAALDIPGDSGTATALETSSSSEKRSPFY